ncbi:ComEC/Rec2 family competence protein [Clostridium sp. Marseille-P299]|uniref:ComEC/Rec2 family competence protein n=1 Tax=Clostridium sp. Marseille-P299 TaxID=1805477 RepID=UPI0008309BD1|nr:ComEC/Rec2 family competence protein [Clostridium sp. Marseille-P299]
MKKYLYALLCLLFVSFAITGCDVIDIDSFFVSSELTNDNSTNDDANLKVHFIDVGQADCILIESSNQYMLVDAGNNADEELIISYLNNLGIKRLEYVIGTHPHEDHIGSLDAVIRNYEIGKVILPEKEHTTKTFENVLDAIEEKNLKITKPKVGDKYEIGDASFVIIAPNNDYGDELNNWSVGIKLTLEDTSFVMCGDAEKEAEEDILSNGIDLKADVLKLGHHGSRTSSSKDFVDAVDPSYIVITCGADNSYGHPHKETMKWLKKRGIPFFRTDKQGTIIATSDGDEITWNVEPSNSYEAGNR